MLHRNTLLGILIPSLLAGTVSLVGAGDGKGPTIWSFEKDEVGKPPAGFEFAVTAKKQPGKWVVAKDGGGTSCWPRWTETKPRGASQWRL